MAKTRTRSSFRPKLISLAVASCFTVGTALANPTGANVVRGTAAIHQAGNLLQITNSPNAIINWQSFSIGANEITRFIQQSQASAVLNRVTGAGGRIDPSVILGTLQSNGRVFLINPNGILFGAGAKVDVAGLVASSLNLSNEDFLAGRQRFTEVPGAGAVINQGSITTGAGGSVYLVGSAVTNSGVITSPQGEVILAAGNSVELVDPGTPNLRVEIAAADHEARNLGQIISDAGRVGIYAGLINNSGTIRADSAVAEGGRIVLKATKSTTLENSSVLSAQGQGGGRIEVLAEENVSVAGRLDASAPYGGDGGFIETSAKIVTVEPSTIISGAAPYGKTGTWFIDPLDFTIAPSGGDITGATLSANLGSLSVSILSDQGEVGVNGDIFVNDAVTWSSGNSLTLTALRFVEINKPLTGPNGGVFLNSGSGVMQSPEGAITANQLYANGGTGSVLLNAADNRVNVLAGDATGTFSFINGQSLQVGALPNQQSGIQVTSNGSATIDVSVTSGSLNVAEPLSAQARGDGMASISLSAGGDITTTAAGSISANFSTGNNGGGSANVALNAGGSITVGGPIVAQGNFGSSDNGGGVGGNASVSLNAGTNLAVNSSITATAGAGEGVKGGDVSVMLSAGGALTVNASINATGGAGGMDFGSGANGGAGGSALVSVNGGTIDTTNSFVSANGGDGGDGGSHNLAGGLGGNGGSATVALSGGAVSVTGSNIFVGGGRGGVGGNTCCSSGGDGGNGGNGASATVTISGSSISLSSSNVSADGGNGGGGGSGVDGIDGTGGAGGNAGGGSITLTAGSISISSGDVFASGGFGGRGGGGSNSIGGNGGNGGNAMVALNGGGISIMSSNVGAFGGSNGSAGFGVVASGTQGAVGGGGSVIATGSTIVAQNSFIQADGAEGSTGGAGVINLVASGDVTLTSTTVAASGGDCCGDSDFGGTAAVGMAAGGNITVDGGGGIFAEGGGGNFNGGTAAVTLVANGGITVNGPSVQAFGGSGFSGNGGAAAVTFAANGGAILVQNTPRTVAAFGGAGAVNGGSAVVTMSAASGITLDGASVEARGYPTPLLLGGGGGEVICAQCLVQGSSPAQNGGLGVVSLDAGTGTLDLLNGSFVHAVGGAGTVTSGAGQINLTFSGRSMGGYFIDGIEGLIVDDLSLPTTGFFVNFEPAILDTNLFAIYLGNQPVFNDILVATMNQQADVLADQLRAGEVGEEEEKKKLPFCD